MAPLHTLLDMVRHPDDYLRPFAEHHPVGIYGIVMAIVFCETGLVVTPFLPGDTLLFLVGTLAAMKLISLPVAIVGLCLAANAGDLVNYLVGRAAGPRVFSRRTFLLNPRHLAEAQAFYEKHGRKTIILARFVPIIRTFAPFVAGVGRMTFPRFIGFSVGGGALWVTSIALAGYLFGGFRVVHDHIELVAVAIVVISVLPMAIHAVQARRKVGPDAGAIVADVNA